MAKGSKSKSNSQSRQRDTSAIATRQRVLVAQPSPIPSLGHVTPADRSIPRPAAKVPVVDDRRTFHPLAEYRPVKTISGRNARLVVKNRPRTKPGLIKAAVGYLRAPKAVASQTKAALSWVDPSHVAVCVRRKTRRQVLAALKKFASGAGSKRRHSPFSRVRC